MKVYIKGTSFSFSPSDVIGSGGEADIFNVDGKVVAKIFKSAKHPDFARSPAAQKAAEIRILHIE